MSRPSIPTLVSTMMRIARASSTSREGLERHRDRLLRRVVRHAGASVPYYRELLDGHGVNPDAIRTAADLCRFPTTDKRTLQSQPIDRVLAAGREPDALLARSTSGSDGRPLVVYRTWTEQNLLHLFRLRAQRSVGLRLRDRFVTVGLVRERLAGDDKRMGRWLTSLGFYRRWRVDTFQGPRAIVAELERLRPDVLGGYPGVLARVADAVAETGAGVEPRLLLSGAEVLTPLHRQRIEAGFGSPVFDLYGCHELNLVAWECPTTGELHTCDDALVVEVLDGDEPVGIGERGEVVVTGLLSYAMPFLRYRLGDVAVRGEDRCPCGRSFATLRRVEGRVFEHFALPGGRSFHPHALGRILLSEAGLAIRQYQLVQERPDSVVARIVVDPGRSLDREALRRRMQAVLGPAVRCEVRVEREISVEATGKHRVYKVMDDGTPSVDPTGD